MIRQQTVGNGAPAKVTVDGAVISDGNAGVVFDTDGGTLDVSNIEVESLTADALVAAANGAKATLSNANIESSSMTSITITLTGSVQNVIDTTVSSMLALEDAFLGSGTNTDVFLTRTTIQNNALTERWRILNVRDGAEGRATRTTVARNTALQFGFTASSSRSLMIIDHSFFIDNFGLDVSTKPRVLIVPGYSLIVVLVFFAVL